MKPFVITSILVPTDLTEASIPALRYARLFADRFLARLTVMHVEPILYPLDSLTPMETVSMPPRPQDEVRMLSQVTAHVRPAMGDRPFDIALAVGQPIPAILSAAREHNADFIVMGAHLRYGWRRALLGSVSEGVLYSSTCPVLMVASHDGASAVIPSPVANILCPVNFTDVAHESLHVAARLAEAFHARLTIVHVVEGGQAIHAGVNEEKIRNWIPLELRDICTYRELVVRGGSAERVLDCADDLAADLVVIGAQHRHFRNTTILGTTTERLVRFSSTPILVVPRVAVGSRRAEVAPVEEPELSQI